MSLYDATRFMRTATHSRHEHVCKRAVRKNLPEEKFLWKTCCIIFKNLYNYFSDIFP